MRIAVLNGPNLNLLGAREPELYGHTTLQEIEAATRERARTLGVDCSWTQTNFEGELVEAIQQLGGGAADGAVINAAESGPDSAGSAGAGSTDVPLPPPRTSGDASRPPVEDETDLDQFQAWLRGLKS